MSNDVGPVVEKVEAILEKFDGDPEDGVLVERIVLVDGELVSHEKYENGELVSQDEGGNYGTN